VPDYWYKALTGSGSVQEGWINAASEVQVEEELRRQGAFLIQTEVRTRARKVTDGPVERRELLAFLEYLSGSFTAGIPLLTILDDIPRRLRSARLKAIINEVRTAVADEGKSLSDAMADHPRAFPRLFIATIQAGEASGQLAFSLQQLVEYLDWQENISASVRQATMYPVIVLGAVSLLVGGLVGFVFPRIIPILRTRDVELPLPTKIIMTLSLTIRENWLAVLVLLAVVTVTIAGGCSWISS
jgi:type IV pilus assembly protein PilC